MSGPVPTPTPTSSTGIATEVTVNPEPEDEVEAQEDQSKNAKPYPEPQSAKGAYVNDAGVDLNESANHGPNVQGNKYGVSDDALNNYISDLDQEIERLKREITQLESQRDSYQEQLKDKD